MMRSSFRWKLTTTYILIIVLILVVTGIFLSVSFKDYYYENVKTNLTYQSILVAEMTGFYDQQRDGNPDQFMQNICDNAAVDTDTRVTIVDAAGRVMCDSNFDADVMESHEARPEIYLALQGKTGIDIRKSRTAGIKMLYIAVPFDNGNVSGAVRLSRPLEQVQSLYHNSLYILLAAILLIGIIAFLISLGVANRFSRPIKDITEEVQGIARGNLEKRINYQADDEICVLVNAVNNMAEDLKHTIDEISRVKNRLETLLDNTVNGILMVDKDARLIYANPMAIFLLSTPKYILGRKHVEVIRNYELVEIIDKVNENHEPVRKEIVLHASGDKTVEVNVVPIIDKDTSTNSGILVVINDITDIKKLEKVRKDFVANVSHELKTPVAAISGFAETLLAEGSENPNIQEFSSIIYREAQRLKRLIERLLELSRIESGITGINIELLDMRQIIEEAIDIIKKRNSGTNTAINFDPGEKPIYVHGDEDLIIQIMINLLDNAVNYSPDGTSVNVKMNDTEKEVKVSVADRGEGIPEKDKQRVFERFYRVDKARSRKTGGTGLGLSIVKHLVEDHGGRVGVESSVGEGSTFYFILPKAGEKGED